jgi:hypothetical protein
MPARDPSMTSGTPPNGPGFKRAPGCLTQAVDRAEALLQAAVSRAGAP